MNAHATFDTDDPITEAVNLLIEAENYSTLAQEMTRAIERPVMRVAYVDEHACFNALVDLGETDRNAFERLLKLIDAKRQENPKTAKRDYQRDIMRDRRKRMAKAILLHEARSGPLRGTARAAEMTAIRARWTRAKAQFIVDRQSSSSVNERLQATRDFWEMVDRQLDANLANVHRTSAVV
jgi:hypothetical protein